MKQYNDSILFIKNSKTKSINTLFTSNHYKKKILFKKKNFPTDLPTERGFQGNFLHYFHWNTCGFVAGKFVVDLNLYSAADSAGTFPENYKICKKQLPMKVLARNHYKYEAIQ
jgi:hypothetical protein